MWRVAFALCRVAIVLTLAAGLAAPQGAQSTANEPFIECGSAELVRAVPELAGIQFDPKQDRLDALLQATGENLESTFANFTGISAAEEIHEMRFADNLVGASRVERFRYIAQILHDATQGSMREYRTEPGSKAPVEFAEQRNFLVLEHFIGLLSYLLPGYREQSFFRYVGRIVTGGQDSFVVAFAQRRDGTGMPGYISSPDGRSPLLQGLVWIDAAANRILRLRLDLLDHTDGFPLDTLTTDISLAPVNFRSIQTVFLLPSQVTVHARYAAGDLHTVHRYSDYRLAGADDESNAGLPTLAAGSAEDKWELLAKGIALVDDGKSGDAIVPLREALRLHPEMAYARYYLAVALHATSDYSGAEAELREALKLLPDSGPIHNLLGVLLFRRGDMQGSVAEFRRSTDLQPKDAVARSNLGQILEKLGDVKGAIEAYRTAAVLAPNDAKLRAKYERAERASNTPPVPAVEATIKVDVRQVLVPVIVTGDDGHHATGLIQSDFKVFENGVEQKISGFSVENIGADGGSAALRTSEPNTVTERTTPKNAPQRTYLICIDTLHAAFENQVHVRDALEKLFREEHAGDSRYIVIAVGVTAQLVLDATSDPQAALGAVESKDFEKLFLASKKQSMETDLRMFQGLLEDARNACRSNDPSCGPRKNQLPFQAGTIAASERSENTAFLSQLRSSVQVLSHGNERHTMILISDGFQLVPGTEAYELLEAYFPDLSGGFHTVDRMQDDFQSILRLAANSNIPIYTIDARGLYTPEFLKASAGRSVMTLSRSAQEAGDVLHEIAAATGGTAFQGSNDILMGLERAFADGREYYTLAYVPSNSNADGKFHAISVQVRNRNMAVRAKRGYWAKSN